MSRCRVLLAILALLPPAMSDQNIVLTAFSAVSHTHFMGLWYTRASHPEANIIVANHHYSDHPYNWAPAPHVLTYLAQLNITLVNISETETPEHARLIRTFKHNSGNGMPYERFCTSRFLTLQLLMDRHNMTNAAMYDMDSFPLQNLFEAYGEDNWGFGSWVANWKRDRVGEFNKFILDFYDGDARRVANNFIKFGVLIPPHTPYWDKLKNQTDSWWPSDLRDQHHMITDMELFTAFTALHNHTLYYCRKDGGEPGCYKQLWRPGLKKDKPEPLYTRDRISDIYSSRALNSDLVVRGSNNSHGCRIFGRDGQPRLSHAEEQKIRLDDFLRVFSVKRIKTSFSPGFDGVYIGDHLVAYMHFNGHCKDHMCLTWMCENVNRWAKRQHTFPDLAALKYCCEDRLLSP